MFTEAKHIPAGSAVRDASGAKVGVVLRNNVEEEYLVVRQGLIVRADLYVPWSVIDAADHDAVHLSRGRSALRDQYKRPPPAGARAVATPAEAQKGQMDAPPGNVWKLRHRLTGDVHFMRFGSAAERFARDGDPPASVFTNRGKPRQVSIAYAADAARIAPDPVHWDPAPERPDWAYEQRRQFDEIA